MIDLKAQSPLQGAGKTIGAVTYAETDPGHLTSCAVFKGKVAQAKTALKKGHKLDWPAKGESSATDDARAIWFGHDTVMLMGPAPNASLAKHAALTDQSDAWAVVTLSGAGLEDVLARLVPIDTRLAAFPTGATARTLMGHMNASLTRLAPDQVLIMVFRSMAGTLQHDLERAMESVAARR